MVASAVAVVVVVGVTSLDATRARLEEELRARTGLGTQRIQVALASFQLAKALTQADRIAVRNSGISGVDPAGPLGRGTVQLRHVACDPPATAACLDDSSRYHWEEYRLSPGGDLEMATDPPGGCAHFLKLASEVASMTFRFRDAGPPPPGGNEPFGSSPDDNNVVEYAVTWASGPSGPGTQTQTFRGAIESRSIAYSKVNSVRTNVIADSGTGIDVEVGGSNTPPEPCP